MGDAAAGVSEYLYMLSDALGSVVALADDDGEIVERYHYSPYGVTPLLQPNVNSNGLVIGYSLVPSRYGNPFLWTSQRIDPNTGFYNFLARTYDPYRGRWLQRDPMGPLGLGGGEPAYGLGTPSAFAPTLSADGEYGDSFSLYQYSRFNPIMMTDPMGRFSYGESMMTQGIAAGLLGMMGSTVGIGLTLGSQLGFGVTGLDAIGWDTFVDATEALMDGAFAEAERLYESVRMTGAGLIVMSSATAAAVKKARDLSKTIDKHTHDVMTGGPDDPDDNKHRREISGYANRILTYAKRMVGRRKIDWTNYAKELRRWAERPGGNGRPPLRPG